MIDSTKATLPPTAAETSAVASRATVTASQAWMTSGNGEQGFAAWLGGQAEPAPPAPPAASAAAPVSTPSAPPSAPVAGAAPGALAGQLAAHPPGSTASAPAASAQPPAMAAPQRREAAVPSSAPAAKPAAAVANAVSSGNGEARFEPVVAGDTAANKGNVHAFAEGDQPTVWDLLDFINPLQHIPVVNLVYRELTGDKIGALPQIVGGALLGGPIGAFSAIVNVAVEEATGKDIGGQVMAMLTGDAAASAASTKLADSATAPASAAVAATAPTPVAPAERPRGRIEVTAPTPSERAAPAAAAGSALPSVPAPAEQVQAVAEQQAQAPAEPAAVAPVTPAAESRPVAENREAAEARKRAASLKMPTRATPTRPVTASALERLSPDTVKPGTPSRAVKTPPANSVNGAGGQENAAGSEALSPPGAPPATSPRRALSASDSVQPQANPGNTADFVSKFMTAMDKYDKASRLTAVQSAAAPTSGKK